jgi:hypothetical protein
VVVIAQLRQRAPTCWLCGWILADLEDDGKLTGWWKDVEGKPIFPRSGELNHLRLEGIQVGEGVL